MKHWLRQRGLTLVELAIGLLIVSLVAGGGLLVLATQMEQNRIKDTQRALASAKEALIGFAQIHGRLPCPATATSNGQESIFSETTGECSAALPNNSDVYIGYLPASTLGLSSVAGGSCEPGGSTFGYLMDKWNRCIRYAVSRASYDAATRTHGIRSAFNTDEGYRPNLRVCRQSTCDDVLVGYPDTATAVVAMVFSTGKNGPAAGPDEAENIPPDVDRHFVMTTLRQDGTAPGGAFDDIVDWLPKSTLIYNMAAAGKLPPQQQQP